MYILTQKPFSYIACAAIKCDFRTAALEHVGQVRTALFVQILPGSSQARFGSTVRSVFSKLWALGQNKTGTSCIPNDKILPGFAFNGKRLHPSPSKELFPMPSTQTSCCCRR